MPIPLLGSSREWRNGELTKFIDGEGRFIGMGLVDTFTKTIKIKRLIKN
jgi:hypothetical protein